MRMISKRKTGHIDNKISKGGDSSMIEIKASSTNACSQIEITDKTNGSPQCKEDNLRREAEDGEEGRRWIGEEEGAGDGADR